MADELHTPNHRWYQPRNHIALAKEDFSKQWIYDSGIQKIDAWIASQPWGDVFSPSSLFSSGEEGAWYEPSQTTAFQSTTDLTPCDYGDACGFLLDKSQGAGYSGGSFTGLGTELVAGGEFNDAGDVAEWTAGNSVISFDSGTIRVDDTLNAGDNSAAYQTVTTVVGKVYLLTAEVVDEGPTSASLIGWSDGWGAAKVTGDLFTKIDVGNGQHQVIFTALSTSSTIGLLVGGTGSATFDNISVRELPGNHATQTSAPSRPTLARVPEGGRRNLLESTHDLTVWANSGGDGITKVRNETGIDGVANTATTLTDDFPAFEGISKSVTVANDSSPYTVSVHVKKTTSASNFPGVSLSFAGGTTLTYQVTIDTDNGAAADRGSADAVSGITVTDEGDFWRVSYSGANNSTGNTTASIIIYPAVTTTYGAAWSGAATGSAVFDAPQLEAGSSATAYQKVVDEYDITEAGVTSLDYLSFDGSDDGMATASIDFTSTDKMSVFAGVEKLSETTTSVFVELSQDIGTNSNSFVSSVNAASGNQDWYALARGSLAIASTMQVASNDSQDAKVAYTSLHDISGDSTILRLNGSQIGEATGDKGTGNFGNYPLNIGARNNAGSLRIEGNLYGLIVRGATSTTAEITNTEAYLATRSGVTLP
jgi:hypothetical protein